MDLALTPAQSAFRDEVRRFIDQRLPSELRDKLRNGHVPSREETVWWHRTLNERGWAAPNWPKQYGGCDLGTAEKIILRDELHKTPAPHPHIFNVEMLGPVILRFGSESQRREWLPRLLNLELWFCQGFSEPNAGSDLASLRTSAVRQGDHYIVNGQKIWTSYAHYADWIFCLVRTSRGPRKQDGISMLLIDLKTPGVTVRPIFSIDGHHHLNEVFFDDVRVPAENMVGQEGEGWACATFLLGNERSMIARIETYRERADRIRELLTLAGGPPGAVRRIKEELAAILAEIRALEMVQWRSLDCDPADPAVKTFASVLKLKGSEVMQKLHRLALRAGGDRALEAVPHADAQRTGHWAAALGPAYFYSRAATIYGGTTEVQKELISRVLF